MRQELTTDSAERYIDAPPEVVYDILADIPRTPERTDDVVRCSWIRGATGPAVGAWFKSLNTVGYGPKWPNRSVVIAADRGREFSFARHEVAGGVVEWRHRLAPEGAGTRVTESYEVTKAIPIVGWFIIGVVMRRKDRRADLRASMATSLDRLAAMAEAGR